MRRLIFLDFDGVLNSERWLKCRPAEEVQGADERSIDPSAVGLLNEIVVRTDADVVVSSTWRHHGRWRVTGLLAARGFIGRVVGVTPDYPGDIRGAEIEHWLRDRKVQPESFVIIDDDAYMGDLKNRLVQTDFGEGLTRDHVELAVQLLSETYILEHLVEAP